jgi:hypothetical protein
MGFMSLTHQTKKNRERKEDIHVTIFDKGYSLMTQY